MTIDEAVALPRPAALFARAADRLPRGSVYRSIAARQTYFDAYDEIVARTGLPIRSLTVQTRFGHTHVSVTGEATAPPLLILPGMSICGPLMLEFFDYLAAGRMLIAPDLVGQAGLSADGLFTPRDNAYGKWLADVLDGLEIDRADMVGPSFGGAIALDLAAMQPRRIGRLALIVTAGLTPSIPIVTAFTPLFLTWYGYRHLPIRPLLEIIARPMCKRWEPRNLDYLEVVIRTANFWRHRPAGPFEADQFKAAIDPVFIAFSRGDHLLPFAQTYAHAHKVLPIADEVIMENSAHMPNAADMEPVHDRIAGFLNG